MNPNTISPDDPRLTLYALHEMEPAEREGFEKLLQQDPAARAAVEEIRATAAVITTALEHEPSFAEATEGRPATQKTGKIIRFPQVYFMISGLAAACFALFFTYWQQNRPVPRNYMEVEVDKLASAMHQKKERQDAEVAAKAKVQGSVAVALPAAENKEVVITLAPSDHQTDAPAAAPQLVPESVAITMSSDAGQPVAPAAPQPVPEAVVFDRVSNANQSVAMDVAEAPPPPMPQESEKTLVLSPFVVSGGKADKGYAAKSAIDSSRVRSELKHLYNTGQLQKPHSESRFEVGGGAKRDFNTEGYDFRKDNDYIRVRDQALSTFSVDVDTASYANVRRFLTMGQRPPADAVRIEELVNYFPYRYAPPTGNTPFAAHLEVASAPWAPEHRLVRIGLKGREISDAQRPAANLVFLLDVSGSMNQPNKLPLVKQSLRLLVNKLRSDDRVAIAVYAGASGLALPSTSASRKAEILDAIDRLEAGGSTNGAIGIQLAYDIAKANFVSGGVNRVILATDGDFNVGVTNNGELTRLIEEKAKSGVFLSVLGFGMGNYKDSTLEQLADKGNGNYAYIDTLAEAKKSLVEQAGGTLVTIAKDVKIQVEFNPAQVQAYRLIGYENRLLAKEDFKNDKVDAGEIGAGHTVTALYEIVPAGAEMPTEVPAVDALKYQAVSGQQSAASQNTAESRKLKADSSSELLTVKIRYKEPAGDVSIPLEFPLVDAGARFEQASADFKFAAAVAGFGMALRDSPHKGSLTLAEVADWGRAGLGDDVGGYRTEFLGLVKQVEALQ